MVTNTNYSCCSRYSGIGYDMQDRMLLHSLSDDLPLVLYI
jgi:hypothetical protein